MIENVSKKSCESENPKNPGSDIPPNWSWVKLSDVAEYINGRAFKPTEWEQEGLPIIRIQNLNDVTADFNYSTKSFEAKYLVETGDLLFAWSASLGTYFWNRERAWLNQHIFKVIPKDKISKRFLFYTLNYIVDQFYAKTHGSGMVHITKNKFEETEIPLPPLPEQKKIVEKIEELFSGLDTGVASLKKAKEQIRLYRQSVLASAFSGRLHQDSPDYMINRIKEKNKSSKSLNPENPQILVNHGSDNLPDGWKSVKLGEVVKIVSGNTPKGLESISNTGNLPFYKVSDMNSVGNERKMIKSNLYLTTEEMKKLKIKIYPKHTTIFPKRGGAILTNKKRLLATDSSFDLNLMGLIPSAAVNYKFLYYWVIKLDLSTIYDGSNVPQINNKNVEPLELSLPPLNQQTQIIEEIEKRFSEADNLEKAIDESLAKSETLRQSILKKAFEGRLI